MRKLSVLLPMLLVAGPLFAGGPTKFKPEEFSDPAKASKKYVGANAKKLKELKGKKLIIIECAGEFIQEQKTIDAGFTVATSTIRLNNESHVKATDRVYETVKKILEDNGMTVAPKEELLNNATYQELDLKSERGTKAYKGGIGKQGKETKGEKVSASGMGVFNTMSMFGLLKRLPHIIHETGSQGGLRINYKVDKGKNGSPVLSMLTVVYDGDLMEQQVGFKGNKKVDYYNKTQNTGLFSLKAPLASQVDVRGKERGSVDLEVYDKALMEMVNAVAAMFSAQLQAAAK